MSRFACCTGCADKKPHWFCPYDRFTWPVPQGETMDHVLIHASNEDVVSLTEGTDACAEPVFSMEFKGLTGVELVAVAREIERRFGPRVSITDSLAVVKGT